MQWRLLIVLVGVFFSVNAFAAPVGKVAKMNGSVSFREGSGAAYRALAPGEEVSEGNWLRTGKNGWVELLLADNSKFTLANNTELEVAAFLATPKKKQGTFNLAQGKLRAAVVKLAGQQTDIRVKSGTAVAGIKGTEFLMLSRGPANVFFGNEGTVDVFGSGTASQPLAPWMMTQNTRGINPVEPVKIEPDTPLAKAKAAFEEATGAAPPTEWLAADALPDIIARWNINYGHYLADSGKYHEALHVFQIALDLTDLGEIRADALLERGTVYSRLLNNPEAALAEYLLILEEYPRLPQAESALFTAGQIQFQMGLADQAKARFQQYLRDYPNGARRSTVETLLKLLER
jgi:tetratricopeptide (TPR) repeat protein